MKLICTLITFTVMALPAAFGGLTSATVNLTSNYEWRGMGFNDYANVDAPAIQGSIDHMFDFGFGIWMSNSALDDQINQYMYYWKQFGDVSMTFLLNNFGFSKNPTLNTLDISINLAYKGAGMTLAHIPDYLNSESSTNFAYFNYNFAVGEKIKIIPGLGYHSVGDDKKIGFSSYLYQKLAVQYHKDGWVVELAVTDTDQKLVDSLGNETKQEKNERFIYSLSRKF